MKNRNLLFLLCCLIPYVSYSQGTYLGMFGGVANYSGDLQQHRYTFQQAHPSIGIFLERDLSPNFSMRTEFSLARISADDRYSKDSLIQLRNLSFQSNITELQWVGEYNFLDLTQRKVTPYLFAGLAIFHFNPTALDTNGQRVYLQPLSTEGQGLAAYPGNKVYSLFQIAIPIGGGIKWSPSPNVRIGLEIGLRKTFTDYLDDVSTSYADQNDLLKAKGPLAVRMAFRTNRLPGHTLDPYPTAGTQRGNSKIKDWYYYTGLTISLSLGKGGPFGHGHTPRDLHCPNY